jgi:hypothetical protein
MYEVASALKSIKSTMTLPHVLEILRDHNLLDPPHRVGGAPKAEGVPENGLIIKNSLIK